MVARGFQTRDMCQTERNLCSLASPKLALSEENEFPQVFLQLGPSPSQSPHVRQQHQWLTASPGWIGNAAPCHEQFIVTHQIAATEECTAPLSPFPQQLQSYQLLGKMSNSRAELQLCLLPCGRALAALHGSTFHSLESFANLPTAKTTCCTSDFP